MNPPASRPALRILLVDDHPLLRKGLAELLSQEFPGSEIVQAASLEAAAVQLESTWSLMILDQNLPDGRGVEFLERLESKPVTLMLSMYDDGAMARMARSAGAVGYASKGDSPERLLEAVRAVLDGKKSFPAGTEKTEEAKLSEREREVLTELLKGKTPTEISKDFGVRQTTVQSYKARIFAKLGVGSMAELVKQAMRRGMD